MKVIVWFCFPVTVNVLLTRTWDAGQEPFEQTLTVHVPAIVAVNTSLKAAFGNPVCWIAAPTLPPLGLTHCTKMSPVPLLVDVITERAHTTSFTTNEVELVVQSLLRMSRVAPVAFPSVNVVVACNPADPVAVTS